MNAPPAADRAAGSRWILIGAIVGGLCGVAVMARLMPQHRMIDYPSMDQVLRSVSPIATAALFLSGGLVVLAGSMARTRSALLPFLSGLSFSALMAFVLTFWMYAEVNESDVGRTDLAGSQEAIAAALHVAVDDRLSATAQLGTRSGAAPNDEWLAAARTFAIDFRGTVALALLNSQGEIEPGSAVPPEQAERLKSNLGSIAASAHAGDRAMTAHGTHVLMATPASNGRVLVALVDATAIVQPISAGIAHDLALTVNINGPGSDRVTIESAVPGVAILEPPPECTFGTAGLLWTVQLRPTSEWIDSHHHRANTIILLLGAVASFACALAIRSLSTEIDARAAREFADRAAHGASARARISAHARDAISQEASHVIRARLRETARALDAATDSRGSDASRAEALQRIGASLTHAETEVAALLEATPHTRVAQAEHAAEIDHHYASAVLEFPGGPTVPLTEPVSAEAMAQIQRELGSSTFAVITSDNPMSIPGSPHANMLRRSVLALELRNAKLVHRPVIGRSADGKWSENGFAIAASIGEADALSEIHGQRAYYWFNGSYFLIHGMTADHAAIRLPRTHSASPET
jgi:hypothetical protein